MIWEKALDTIIIHLDRQSDCKVKKLIGSDHHNFRLGIAKLIGNSSDKLRHRISVLNVIKLPHLMFR